MAISLAVTPTGLRVQFTGVDRVAACSRGLDVSFERIVGSRVMTRGEAISSSPRVPCPGSWGIGERRQLWGVRRSPRVIVVYLSGRPFHRLVVDVEEPEATHRAVEAALLHSKKTRARRSLRGLLSGPGTEETGRSCTAP